MATKRMHSLTAPAIGLTDTYTVPQTVAELEDGNTVATKTEVSAEATARANADSQIFSDLVNLEEDLYDLTCVGNNLADKRHFVLNEYITTSGTKYESTSYFHTDYIYVESGETYSINHARIVTAYDSDKSVISNKGAENISSYTVSDNVAFIIVSSPISHIGDLMINKGNPLPYETYTRYVKYDALDSTTKTKIETSVDGLESVTETLDEITELDKSPNLFDSTSEEIGSGYIKMGDGEVAPHSTYWHSGYMNVKKDQMYIYNGFGEHNAMYNSDKSFFARPTITSKNGWNVLVPTIDGYFRFTISKEERISTTMFINVEDEDDIDNYSTSVFIPFYEKTVVKGLENVRNKIEITNNGIDDFYDKMLSAFNSKNCDVYVRVGEYVMTNSFVEGIRNRGLRGVPIGNGCRYYFDTGARIICNYTGNNASDVCNYFSPLDSQNLSSDFEIYNVDIDAKNVCYALHDESNGEEKHCRHIFKNCRLSLDNSYLGSSGCTISKALGGGLGKHEEVIIEDCVFSATNPMISGTQDDASYHGANGSDYTDASIVIKNSWFHSRFRLSNLSNNVNAPFPTVSYNGNSSSFEISYPDNWEVKKWNNEVRNS